LEKASTKDTAEVSDSGDALLAAEANSASTTQEDGSGLM
jgi:hypothetical protein